MMNDEVVAVELRGIARSFEDFPVSDRETDTPTERPPASKTTHKGFSRTTSVRRRVRSAHVESVAKRAACHDCVQAAGSTRAQRDTAVLRHSSVAESLGGKRRRSQRCRMRYCWHVRRSASTTAASTRDSRRPLRFLSSSSPSSRAPLRHASTSTRAGRQSVECGPSRFRGSGRSKCDRCRWRTMCTVETRHRSSISYTTMTTTTTTNRCKQQAFDLRLPNDNSATPVSMLDVQFHPLQDLFVLFTTTTKTKSNILTLNAQTIHCFDETIGMFRELLNVVELLLANIDQRRTWSKLEW